MLALSKPGSPRLMLFLTERGVHVQDTQVARQLASDMFKFTCKMQEVNEEPVVSLYICCFLNSVSDGRGMLI